MTAENSSPPTTCVPEPAGEKDHLTRQERIERTRSGRVAINVFVALTVLALLVTNMPASHIKDGLLPATGRYLNVLGLDQGWGVFSPNPRPATIYVEARILQRSGSTVVEPIPIQHGVAELWDYRWQRWGDQLATGRGNAELWAPYCRWLAGRDRDSGGQPVRIALVARSAKTLPPGPGPAHSDFSENEFFATGV